MQSALSILCDHISIITYIIVRAQRDPGTQLRRHGPADPDFMNMPSDRPLIFDLGMHDGTNALTYLARGFRVVAVEAAVVGARRNGCKVTSLYPGQAVVLNKAIDSVSGNHVTFCHDRRSESSRILDSQGDACKGHKHQVMTISCADMVRSYGTPWMMKIDVEGKESACINSLLTLPMAQRPEIIVFETPLRTAASHSLCASKHCVTQFIELVGTMAVHGYGEWKRQWWRECGGRCDQLLGDEVLDKGTSRAWAHKSEVQRSGCGFSDLSEYHTLAASANFGPNSARSLRHSTGCDLHARLKRASTVRFEFPSARGPNAAFSPNETQKEIIATCRRTFPPG